MTALAIVTRHDQDWTGGFLVLAWLVVVLFMAAVTR